MKLSDELKKALKLLPEAEKDKLILKLLRSNSKQAKILDFELVDTDTVEDKRQLLYEAINDSLSTLATFKNPSMGYLLTQVRLLSGEINEHVLITKDPYGEIVLNCHLLQQTLALFQPVIEQQSYAKAYPICIYIVARIFKILLLIQKQHEDLHIEFKEPLALLANELGKSHYSMMTAIRNGLDVNWLALFELPSNLVQIHKDLRAGGFLR